MSIAPVDELLFTEKSYVKSLPGNEHLPVAGRETDPGMHSLAANVVAAHIRSEADPSAFFDPIEGLSVLKYLLIGDPRLLVRYNSSFPPGVEREIHRGTRVYGVECAALVDPATGWVDILRKDDVVDSADPSDWMLVKYNIMTGEYEEPAILGAAVRPGEPGDEIELLVAPPSDPRFMYDGPSTLSMPLDQMYHTAGNLVMSRKTYYGRGTGQEAPRIEGVFTHDISLLFAELEAQLETAGISPSVLDRGANPAAHYRAGDYGRHVLSLESLL